MVLIKSKPETIFNKGFFPQSFNALINEMFDETRSNQTIGFMPTADVLEKADHFEIRMTLPGIKKEDVKIALEGEMLNIEGERKTELNEENEKFIRRESSYGKFSRSFNVSKLDTSNIEAKFENGILSLSIPKRKMEKSNIIEIK